MPTTTRIILALALLGMASKATPAQQPRLTVGPSRPQPGAIVRLTLSGATVAGDSITAITGTMAGEPLHFLAVSNGTFTAIGGIPVDSMPSVLARVVITRASGRADTLRTSVKPAPLPPPTEQLAVAPRFGQPMDSALQARVANESERARAIGHHSHDTPRLWTAAFVYPRPSAITSKFGAGRKFNGRVTSRHLGVDFKGATGDPVNAANRGVVALVDTFFLGGRIVYVDHGQGVVTAYMHLSRALVAVGDTVQRGQRIGLVGATGRVTGPHLHWAARYGALNVNPLDLVTLGTMPGGAPASTTSGTAAKSVHILTPEIVLTGGKIFTSDSANPWAEAVAIHGDRIVAVGTTAEMVRLSGPSTRRIALGGRVVVPGFNDAHDHLGAAPFGVEFATGGPQPPEPKASVVLDSLKALVRRTRAGTWLHTTIGPDLVADMAVGRAALDRIAPGHPVMLRVWSGHGMVLNSAALRALGIAENVRNPLGGTFERDSAGKLTGILQEYAEWDVLRTFYSTLPAATLGADLRRYAAEAVRTGITTVQDMAGYLDPPTTLRVLRAAPVPIRIRVIPFLLTDSAGLKSAEWQGVDSNPAPRVVISGVKWILDGTPLERRALMRAPYADRAGWYGELEFPPDTVRAILVRALSTRQPLHLHVVGDSTAKLVLDMMQSLAPDSAWRPLRVRFEHGDGVSGDLIPVAKRLGIVIVQNPTHFAFAPGVMQSRFGGTPAGYQGVRSLLAAGIPVAIGSDGPNNPFLNIMLATIHPNDPAEALTREQVVTAYTRGSAYAEFAEAEKGTLAPGMLADLAVLSQDIFTVPPQALPGTSSVMTMVGGRIVYDRLTKR